jgi:uncharacterized protein (TIGR03067 family)
MRRALLLLVLLSLGLAPAPLPRPGPSKADMEKMRGTWSVVRVEPPGPHERMFDPAFKAVIADGAFTQLNSQGEPAARWKLTLDGRKKPGRLTTAEGALLAIYTIEGDVLRISFYSDGATTKLRPSAFEVRDPRQQTVTYRRVKP